jgi:hypothetical protein
VQSATCDSKTKMCVTAPAAPGDGETCGAANQPSCARDHYCDKTGADGGTTGVCRARKTSGACTLDGDCVATMRCVGTTTMTCMAPKADGEACTGGAHECGYVSHCGADGKCTSVFAALGRPCGYINKETAGCARGSHCDVAVLSTAVGTCQADKHDGDACTGNILIFECGGDNAHCDATTKTCASCKP